jgi:hypothetical protein
MFSMLVQMVVCVTGVCGLLCLMDFGFSRMSKWYLLHARYPVPQPPAGVSYTSSSLDFCRVGHPKGFHTGYGRGPRVLFTDAGIYFYFGPLSGMALFHKPFLLPWHHVKRVWKTGRPFEEMLYVRLQAEGLEMQLRLRQKAQPEFFKYFRPAQQGAPRQPA